MVLRRNRGLTKLDSPSLAALSSRRILLRIIMAAALLWCLVIFSAIMASTQQGLLSVDDLEGLVEDIKGDDVRLMRWSASRHTRAQQLSGSCASLPVAMDTLLKASGSEAALLQKLAAEYATFCITDNPEQRAIFSEIDGIHRAVVSLVESGNYQLSAMASHLIYIASFANPANHQGFFRANAVTALAQVIKSPKAAPVQVMYAAAALQNLAASYCDTEDGRCWWVWPPQADIIAIGDNSLPVVADGTSARKVALADAALVERLKELACQGPVAEAMSEDYPYPGDSARASAHDFSPSIVPWAAAGALKNLALEPEGQAMIATAPAIFCYCRLSHSGDWLEEDKGQGLLTHIRRADPCWFVEGQSLCVDDDFIDADNYMCEDYGNASDEECQAEDARGRGTTASQACCGCGGGQREETASHRQEL